MGFVASQAVCFPDLLELCQQEWAVQRLLDLLMSAFKSLVLPLASVGDNASRLMLTALLGDEDGLREDFDGVRKGSCNSSKSMTSPF